MPHMGETLKIIRTSLSLTQSQLSAGIMTQSNYSKMEKGEIDVPFSKMIALLEKLGMSVEEFLYVHNHYSQQSANHLLRLSRLKYNDKERLVQYKKELVSQSTMTTREQELAAIYDALFLIADQNDYETAKQKVEPIWQRLEKHDIWYLYDIQLLNNILYLFPIDTAVSIVSLALKQLKKYKNLRGINNLSANMQMNLVLLLIQHKRYETALAEVERLIDVCVQKNLYLHLALCYSRKGLLLDLLGREGAAAWYEKGEFLLDVMQNDDLKKEIQKEIQQYSASAQ